MLSLCSTAVFLGGITGFWGWDDLPGLVSHPARCLAMAFLGLRAMSLPWFQKAAPRSRGVPGKAISERCFFGPLIGGALLSLSGPFFDRRGLFLLPYEETTRYSGLMLFTVGIFLATWAQWHMGKWFSGHLIIQPDHRLIQNGPFALVRHPRYAGLMLVFVGWPMVFVSGLGLLGGLACALMFLLRIPREESLLAREFGQEWCVYAGKTKRILPGLY